MRQPRRTETLRNTSLFALGASLALAAVSVFAQDATSSPAPAATDKTAPAKTAWEDLDVDKDGNLSKEESSALRALHDVFDQADGNADGMLTGDEYRAYLAANRTDRGQPKMEEKK